MRPRGPTLPSFVYEIWYFPVIDSVIYVWFLIYKWFIHDLFDLTVIYWFIHDLLIYKGLLLDLTIWKLICRSPEQQFSAVLDHNSNDIHACVYP